MSSDQAGAGSSTASGAAPVSADDAQPDDPWFGAGAKAAEAAGDDQGRAEWFLPAGRAGLLPDAMTVAADDGATESADSHAGNRAHPAGAPPWAGEQIAAVADAPPWETGPWPGPGAGARAPGRAAAGPAGQSASENGSTARAGAERASGSARQRWPARTVLVAGLIPLVVPGLVVGIISLRGSGDRAARKASWLAIGASAAWAVIIAVIIVTTSGGAAAACGGYPAAVHQAYEKAVSDLTSNAPVAVQAGALEIAATKANASAAAAGQIGVRTALFAMANDLAQARADVVAGRPVPASLRRQLAADGGLPAGSCAS